jgi:hypothetical protein
VFREFFSVALFCSATFGDSQFGSSCPVLSFSGSRQQKIKVFNFQGDELNMIRYHVGFLGQRIGPISCLAFHPYVCPNSEFCVRQSLSFAMWLLSVMVAVAPAVVGC